MGKAQEKIVRLRQALSHQESDRIPTGEFFWTGFIDRCRQKWGGDFDPYRHFDLDYIVITPNMDPVIQPFEIVDRNGDDIVICTGFGATIRRRDGVPMPAFESFSVTVPEAMADFVLEDPADPRRFYEGGDDQLNCVNDALIRNIPPWVDRLKPYTGDFAVFGSVCEPFEYLWRIIGTENALMWMVQAPDAMQLFIDRLGRFLLDFTRAQIEAGKGQLSGMIIWGDVAYKKGLTFGLSRWRELFKPHVKALIDECHANGLMAVYHGCGNAAALFDDMVEMKLDAYNPLEAKAGLDVVKLKERYAGRLAFVGNIDVRILESGDRSAIEREVRYKLQAARGGGYVFQSDHSISSQVTPESYEWALTVLRENTE